MQRTEYGKKVMHRLIDLDKTQSWLVEQMKAKAEEIDIPIYMDLPRLNAYLAGKHESKYTKYLIEECLCIAETRN